MTLPLLRCVSQARQGSVISHVKDPNETWKEYVALLNCIKEFKTVDLCPHPPPSSRENKAVDVIKCSLMRCDIMQYAQRMHFHKGENFITGPSANRINTLEERERHDATTGATLKGPSGLSRSWTNCLSGIRFHGEIQNTSELGICCSKVYGLFSESQTHSSSSTDSKFYSFITVYAAAILDC